MNQGIECTNCNKIKLTPEDKLILLNEDLKKANTIMAELALEYFGKYDMKVERDRLYLAHEFPLYKVLAEVVLDYVFSASNAAEELIEIADRLNK